MFSLYRVAVHNQITRKLHHSVQLHSRRTSVSNFKQPSKLRGRFTQQLLSKIRLLRYSYFAAIGGSSQDGPPPNLSAQQVSVELFGKQKVYLISTY